MKPVIEVTANAIVPRHSIIKITAKTRAPGLPLISMVSPYPTVERVMTVIYTLSKRLHPGPPRILNPATPIIRTTTKMMMDL
jgi:hypothetical protein